MKDVAVFRWMGALAFLAVVTGLLTLGVIPTEAIGLARTLTGVYVGLLVVSLGIGIIAL